MIRKALALILALAGSTATGFEFRGLRTGMTEAEITGALTSKVDPANRTQKVDCLPMRHGTRMCILGKYAAMINRFGVVASIHYHFNSDEASCDSFASAFERKYGKPAIGRHVYLNKAGNQFTAIEYSWQHGTQMLSIEDACSGEIGEHCIDVTDGSLIDKDDPEI